MVLLYGSFLLSIKVLSGCTYYAFAKAELNLIQSSLKIIVVIQ
ncbi:hypothetical protein JCM19294_1638 [Nonlabens tegetincola]|uniref:Uncharacterized protein n=1 Tax=Nonlabens tegetincola TaxID=323273 RepID=A0A090QRD7_9FLAO|nr:hypothetical protein JCM19294_1638 [Nonlabens tegetincola]